MTGIVLQARLDSSRLPEKSLLPLGGRPLILRVMEALNKVPAELRVLACPGDSVAAFGPLAAEAGFSLFGGPKDDVLKRYCLAIQKFGMDNVIRATGDNPFVFADAAAEIVAQAIALGADYAGYGGLPVGGGWRPCRRKPCCALKGIPKLWRRGNTYVPSCTATRRRSFCTVRLPPVAGREGTCGLPLTRGKTTTGRNSFTTSWGPWVGIVTMVR